MQATPTMDEVAFTRGLPANLEAERVILGSILMDDEVLDTANAVLTAEDFSLEKHRRIFSRMNDIAARGGHVNRVSLAEELMRYNQLESVDGLGYVVSLDDGLPKIVNIEGYIRLVRDKATLRRMIYRVEQISSELDTRGARPELILGKVEAMADDIAGRLIESRGLSSIEQFIVASGLNPYEWLADRSAKMAVENPIVGMRELLDGYRAGELVIVAARPGCGKTALAGQIVECSCRSGVGTAFYSLEMAAPQIISRLVCGRANVNSRALRKNELNEDGRQRVSKEFAEVFEWPLLLADKMAISVAGIRSTIRPLVAAGKIGLLVIDYLGLLVGKARAENRNQEVSEISRGLKRLARELEIPVIALHQLSRDVEKRGGKPKLSDLRDSGSIEQDADIVQFIHVNESDAYKADYRGISSWRKPCNLMVAKQRNGAVGEYDVDFVPRIARFVAKDDI